MNKRTAIRWSATWTLLTLLLGSLTFGHASSSSANAHTLMSLSGLNEQLDALPNAVRHSFNQLLTTDGIAEPFETTDIPRLKRAVESVFNADALKQAILAELETTLSRYDTTQLIDFYLTDMGTSLRSSERDNSLLENADRFQVWYQTHGGLHRLDGERQDVIRELELAMRATDGAVDAMIGMQLAMQVSLTPMLPAAERLSAEQLSLEADRMRPGLTAMYYESSLETLAFVFQDQPVEALKTYAATLQSASGQQFVNAVNNGLSRGLFEAAEQLGLLLGDIVAGRLGQGA